MDIKTIPEQIEDYKSLNPSQTPSADDMTVRYPYTTYEDYYKIDNLQKEDRFNYLSQDLSEDKCRQYQIKHLDKSLMDTMLEFAAVRLSQELRKKKIKGPLSEVMTGYLVSNLSRFRKLRSPLRINIASIICSAYGVLETSVHDFITGDKDAKILLPYFYSMIASKLLNMNAAKRQYIHMMARKIYQQQPPSNEQESVYLPRRGVRTITKERMMLIARERGYSLSKIFDGVIPGITLSQNLFSYKSNAQFKMQKNLPFLLFLSLETGTAIDFFIVEDFGKYLPVYYCVNYKELHTDKKEYKQIEDEQVVRIIEILAAIQPEDRTKLMSEILSLS